MPIEKLSTNPALSTAVENLRALVDHTGHCAPTTGGPNDNTPSIRDLIASPQNANGAFYKYYFDTPTGQYNPAGNNILLLAIAKGAMNSVNRDTVVAPLVDIILQDAASKLTPAELNEFISFKFIGYDASDYYFHNTPLTLAIEAGMISTASKLVDLGADVNATSYRQNGEYTPLHLLALRLPRTKNPEEVKLMDKIKANGADLEKLDVYGRSVKDLANLHDVRIADSKKIVFAKEADAAAAGLLFWEQPDAGGVRLIKAYSLNELCTHPGFRGLYESKYKKALPTNPGQKEFALFREEAEAHEICFLYTRVDRDETEHGKFNCFDSHIIQYDGNFQAPTNFSGGEKHHHHYDAFHNTELHIAECTILGITPCPGH
jgi:hypothetical protein